MRHVLALALALLVVQPDLARAVECTADSRLHRVPLLELYTSEGCDSCPPADRWVSGLPRRGLDAARVVVLAFHVDYWDRLGWVDRFGQQRFSERQRLLNNRNGARVVYTPQLVVNGKDYRRGSVDAFGAQLADLARVGAKAYEPSINNASPPVSNVLNASGYVWKDTANNVIIPDDDGVAPNVTQNSQNLAFYGIPGYNVGTLCRTCRIRHHSSSL